MKKMLFVLAACLAAGCTNAEKQAQDSASMFLDAFLSNDYEKAVDCCSEELKDKLQAATGSFSSLDSNIKELLVKECSKYSPEIVSAARAGKSDTVVVEYRIGRKADSLQFQKGAMGGTLYVLDGKIIRLGK